jgi:hypothetical protein
MLFKMDKYGWKLNALSLLIDKMLVEDMSPDKIIGLSPKIVLSKVGHLIHILFDYLGCLYFVSDEKLVMSQP